MGLKEFIMVVNSQAAVLEPVPEPEIGSVIISTYRSVSNKYVDLVFTDGIYADSGRVNPVTTANFSIVDFVAGGTTVVAIAAVKRNTHFNSGTALALIGGETVIRVFLTLTGTPTSTESFRIRVTAFDPDGIEESSTSATVKLNITPLMLWDYLETGSYVTTGFGISALNDVMGVANLTQTTDADRPLDADGVIYFDRDNTECFNGGDVGALDFQKGNSFTIVLKKVNVLNSGTSGWIIANRANDPGNNGWGVQCGTDGSLFFALHDGTLQGFVDVDAFAGTERTVFCVNNNGTMNVYDDTGATLGTTGNATGIGTVSYTSVSLFLGRRGNNAASWLEGWWEKIAVVSKAMTADERADFIENMN